MTTAPQPSRIVELIRSQANLFDTERQAVIGTTLDGRIVSWNRAATQIYGWRADEVVGRDILEVTPTALSREQATEIMAFLRAGRSWTGDFLVRRKDGGLFHARVSDLPVHDEAGDLVGIVGISWPLKGDLPGKRRPRESGS